MDWNKQDKSLDQLANDLAKKKSGDLTPFERGTLEAIDRLAMVERALALSQRQTRFISIIALLLLIVVLLFFVYKDHRSDVHLANTIKEFTTAERKFKYHDLDWKGQKDEYRKLMMKVFRVYGKAYNRVDVRALSKDEKPLYIDLCFDLAKDLGMPLTEWHGPIFGIMESALNPKALGDFITRKGVKKDKKGRKKEVIVKIPTSYGMYQMKQSCGIYYKHYYNMQPNWFKKKYPITYRIDEDALNWRTATILLYCGMWGAYTKTYKGVASFAISSHRFGPILERYFDDGNGKLPTSFTYIVDGDKITYPVSDYWTDFLGMKECFEAGEIELGKPFRIHWAGVNKQIKREEAQFSKNFKTFKYFKKEIDQLKKDRNDRDKRILSLEKDIDNTYYKLVKKLGEIKSGEYKSVSEKFDQATGIVKDWMREYIKTKRRNVVLQWILLALGILLMNVIAVFIALAGVKAWIQTIRQSWHRWQEKRNRARSSEDGK